MLSVADRALGAAVRGGIDLPGQADGEADPLCARADIDRLLDRVVGDRLSQDAGAARPFRRAAAHLQLRAAPGLRSEEHTSGLQSLMRISYAVFCLKKKQKV